jgi:O-6-methylguanine DNA methyltransferase
LWFPLAARLDANDWLTGLHSIEWSLMKALYYTTIETEIGLLTAVASERGLCCLEFDRIERQALLPSRLSHWFPDCARLEHSHPRLDEARNWLSHYFAGRFEQLSRVSLDLRGTDFERQVWDRLIEIEPGITTTYGELASELRSTRAARAVGSAVGRNPVSIIVPCHRVIGRNGSLTGYGGGLERKRWLLAHEGVLPPMLFQPDLHQAPRHSPKSG